MVNNWRHTIYVVLAVLSILAIDNAALAQKNKKNKSSQALAEHTKRESEYLFIEAQKYYTLEDYAKSANLFLKCIELVPENSAVFYKLAQIAVNNNEIDKALGYALKALQYDESNKYYYLITANIFTEKGDFDKAAEYYEQLVTRISGAEEYLFELAAIYLYQERLDDALSTYQKAEDAFGVNEQTVFQKQKIYLQLNKLEEAIAEGRSLIKTYPDESAYYISLADLLMANNRSGEAIELLNELLVISPENGQAKLVLSDLYKAQGDFVKSQALLTSAFNDPNVSPDIKVQIIAALTQQISQSRSINNPNSSLEEETKKLALKTIEIHVEEANAYAVYGDLLYALNRKREALTNYLKTVELQPDNFQVWQNIFQLDTENNDVEASIEHLEAALEVYPNQSVIYMYYGLALTKKKDFEEAVVILEQGRMLATGSTQQTVVFYSLLGNAYNAMKEFSKSDQSYEKAIALDPYDYQTLNNYSYFLSLRKENLDKAEKMAQRLVQDNPSNITYIDTYSWVLYANEKYKEAKKQMDKILDSDKISAVHYDHYGDILFKLGDVNKAVEYWLRAKGMNPDLDNIDRKIADRRTYDEE